MNINLINIVDNKYNAYGFNVYNEDGYSLPKGMITSFVVTNYGTDDKTNTIEFSMQSPTGDASDHYNYTMPCETFEQGKFICDMYLTMAKAYLNTYLVVNTNQQ